MIDALMLAANRCLCVAAIRHARGWKWAWLMVRARTLRKCAFRRIRVYRQRELLPLD